MRALRPSVVVVGVVMFMWLGSTANAAAKVFHVTHTADSIAACSGSSCPSLRSAVLASNAAGGTNTIVLPAGTYKLTRTPSGPDDGKTGDLHITTSLTINGAGPGTTTIEGDQDRVFDIFLGASQVTLSGMTMTHGSKQLDGGAVHEEGPSLTLKNDVLSNNATSSAGSGGAVSVEPQGPTATLTVTNTVFRLNNIPVTGSSGGGLGGAINFQPNNAGTMTVRNSEFDTNTVQAGTSNGGGFGGAISFETGTTGKLTIIASTFSSNKAAGSSSQGGFGGAVSFEPTSSPSTLSITNSTFTGNSAGGQGSFGGAVDFELAGGGANGTLTHVTMARNSTSTAGDGGGIYVQNSPMTVRNSIISGNTSGGAANNCHTDRGGTVVPQGHNIEKGKTCGFDINADPLLIPLANNGGPTKTMAIPASSPAHDAADPSFCPATDQRGVKRPDDPGTPCDIGAFEFVTPAPPSKKHHKHNPPAHHHHHVTHHHHPPSHKPHHPHRGFTG